MKTPMSSLVFDGTEPPVLPAEREVEPMTGIIGLLLALALVVVGVGLFIVAGVSAYSGGRQSDADSCCAGDHFAVGDVWRYCWACSWCAPARREYSSCSGVTSER